jgi:hypothetical protein
VEQFQLPLTGWICEIVSWDPLMDIFTYGSWPFMHLHSLLHCLDGGRGIRRTPSYKVSHPRQQSFTLTPSPPPGQHCINQITIMDDQAHKPDNIADDETQKLIRSSTPPTRETPDGTDTRASQPKSRVSFLAEPPRTSLQRPHQEPLHPGEHVRVLQTETGLRDMVSINPDDPRSRPTQTPTWYPSGTRYSLIEEDRGLGEDGQSLVAVSRDARDIFIRGSMFNLPENTLVKLGRGTIVRPIFGHSQSRSHNPAPSPPSESDRLSHLARELNESMRGAKSGEDEE